MHTGQVCVFGSAPKRVLQPQNSLLAVESCTCTSKPIIVVYSSFIKRIVLNHEGTKTEGKASIVNPMCSSCLCGLFHLTFKWCPLLMPVGCRLVHPRTAEQFL